MAGSSITTIDEATWTDARKAEYFTQHPENFAGPSMSFPIKDASDISDAWTLAGHASNPATVRSKIISIAKRLGFSSALPTIAKEDSSPPSPLPFSPKSRIATLTVRFLRDGAQSLNGRMYPRESVDRLIQSANETFADPNGMMLTSYTSHDAADRKDTFNLSGKITRAWREGVDALAQFDIADTTAGRDMVSLVQGGYLRTMSLRAKNAELRMDKGYPLPIVTGPFLQLEGIDFTPTPGLPMAQIQSVITESSQMESLTELFSLDTRQLILETVTAEEQLLARIVESVIMQESIPMLKSKLEEAHSTLHGLCMSAKEAGRTISKATEAQIGQAHDAVAMALGIACSYASDPDNDAAVDPSDTDDTTPSDNQEGETPMTKEEALQLLKDAGYTVEEPKSAEQKLREEFEARMKAQNEAFEARLAALTPQPAPQRQTLVEGANVPLGGTQPTADRRIYQRGHYLTEELQPSHWAELASRPDGVHIDRRTPWPERVNPKWALHELTPLLSARITENEARMQGIEL